MWVANLLKKKRVIIPVVLVSLGIAYWIIGLIQYRNNVMDVEDYDPISTLVVPKHELKHSKFPFIDVHNHQWTMPVQDLDKLIKEMDSLNMGVMVNFKWFQRKVFGVVTR